MSGNITVSRGDVATINPFVGLEGHGKIPEQISLTGEFVGQSGNNDVPKVLGEDGNIKVYETNGYHPGDDKVLYEQKDGTYINANDPNDVYTTSEDGKSFVKVADSSDQDQVFGANELRSDSVVDQMNDFLSRP